MVNKNLTKVIVLSQVLVLTGFFLFFFMFVPKLNFPHDGATLDKSEVKFDFKHANVILIDDNEDFSSPKQINFEDLNFSSVLFEPGTYYWKAVGLIESQQRKFTIPSTVSLDVENNTLTNSGDVDLDVKTYNSVGATGLVVLSIDVDRPIEDKGIIKFEASQHEE